MRLSEVAGSQGTVLVFWSNRCPWVDRYEGRLQELVEAYERQGVGFALVNANDPSSNPRESLEESRRRAQDYDIPYLIDEEGRLAEALGASRTPQVFVFDRSNTLVYVGAIDDSPGDPRNVDETYLRDALEAMVQGQDVEVEETEAFGCILRTF